MYVRWREKRIISPDFITTLVNANWGDGIYCILNYIYLFNYSSLHYKIFITGKHLAI